MKPFDTHEEIRNFRQLCEHIAKHPEAFERFINEVRDRAFQRVNRDAVGKEVFRRYLRYVKKIGERIAAEETEYWQQK